MPWISPTRSPTITSATSNSISVNPRLQRLKSIALTFLQVPGANICVVALSAGNTVGTETENIDFSSDARVQVLVWIAPRIFWKAFEVSAGFPVRWNRRVERLGYQCLQSLLGLWVAVIIEPVKLK